MTIEDLIKEYERKIQILRIDNSTISELVATVYESVVNDLRQVPRVLTLEEVRLLGKDAVVWYEHKGVVGQPRPRVVEFVFDDHITFTDGGIWAFSTDCYGERWRLWTSRPTDGQREATPWK